jgi:hypothetical protein
MTTASLRDALGDYIATRRVLRYRLVRPEKLLTQFLDYLERSGTSLITVDRAAVRVAAEPRRDELAHWVSVVHGFAAYVPTLGPRVEIATTRSVAWRRAIPYLCSPPDRRATGRRRISFHRTAASDDRHVDRAAGRDECGSVRRSQLTGAVAALRRRIICVTGTGRIGLRPAPCC